MPEECPVCIGWHDPGEGGPLCQELTAKFERQEQVFWSEILEAQQEGIEGRKLGAPQPLPITEGTAIQKLAQDLLPGDLLTCGFVEQVEQASDSWVTVKIHDGQHRWIQAMNTVSVYGHFEGLVNNER